MAGIAKFLVRCACGRTWLLTLDPEQDYFLASEVSNCPACTGNRVRFNHPAQRMS